MQLLRTNRRRIKAKTLAEGAVDVSANRGAGNECVDIGVAASTDDDYYFRMRLSPQEAKNLIRSLACQIQFIETGEYPIDKKVPPVWEA
jgi:hypothetical protein